LFSTSASVIVIIIIDRSDTCEIRHVHRSLQSLNRRAPDGLIEQPVKGDTIVESARQDNGSNPSDVADVCDGIVVQQNEIRAFPCDNLSTLNVREYSRRRQRGCANCVEGRQPGVDERL
jgi:hypothetical protein